MSIPVVPEHKKILLPCSDACPNARGGICQDKFAPCPYSCAPDCPRCLVIKWAQWLMGLEHGRELAVKTYKPMPFEAVHIPISDWEQIKKLAEEETK